MTAILSQPRSKEASLARQYSGSAGTLAPHRDVCRERTPAIKVIVGLRRYLLVSCGSRVSSCIQVIVDVSNGDLEIDFVHALRSIDFGDSSRQFLLGFPKVKQDPALVHGTLPKPPNT
jgi:hypothetical protein